MTTLGFNSHLKRRWLVAAVCALATSACGAPDDEVVELDDPGQSAEVMFSAFADRYSRCGEEVDQVGPSLLESVQTWSVLRSGLSARSTVRRSLQFDAQLGDIGQGSTTLVAARLEAHRSMVEGVELGMSTPKAKVVLGVIPEGDIDYVQVALIVLPDGLVLAPGDCMTASLFGRDASPARQQEVSAFLLSVIGATGKDLRRRVSEFDQGATTPANQVEQILPGSGSAGPSAPGRTTVRTCDVAELERAGKALDECN